MSNEKSEPGNQTLDKSRLVGANDPKRAERTPEYKGGYLGPSNGGPADLHSGEKKED